MQGLLDSMAAMDVDEGPKHHLASAADLAVVRKAVQELIDSGSTPAALLLTWSAFQVSGTSSPVAPACALQQQKSEARRL